MRRSVPRALPPLLVLAAVGCAATPSQPDTGARAVAQTFCDALRQQDWALAYEQLHPDCRARWSLDQFTRRARAYRRGLGFEPSAVHVRASEERGEEATIRIAWTGRAGDRSRQYKDALVLRRSAMGWRMSLPVSFGQARR